MLLISPKNSAAAIEHLLTVARATLLIVESSGLILGLALKKSISGISTLSFAGLDVHDSYPASVPLSPEQVALELDLPAFYLHTSGSTGAFSLFLIKIKPLILTLPFPAGHPKMISWSHRFFLAGSRSRQRDGTENIGRPFYSIPPLFHASGLPLFFFPSS